MRTDRALVSLIACVFACVLFTPALHAQKIADIGGTWNGSTEVPDAGTDQVTMVLKKAENGYTGTVSDSLAFISPNTELKNVTFTDGILSYSFSLADGAVVNMKLKVDGEKLAGDWTHQEGASAPIVFERKKA